LVIEMMERDSVDEPNKKGQNKISYEESQLSCGDDPGPPFALGLGL
jgi:hypothetical protein